MHLLLKYLKQNRALLFLTLGLAAINQFFSLLDPQIFRLLVDNYANKASELTQAEFIQGVLLLLLGIIGVALISRIAKNFQDYYANTLSQRFGARIYAESVAHALMLPYSVFEDQRSGELLGKLEKAKNDSQALIGSFINIFFVSMVGIALVLTYAFFVHWLIGLVYALIIPVLGSITFLISRKIKSAQASIVRERVALAGSTTETLRNVELVKSLGLEEQEVAHLNKVNEEILRLELEKVKIIRTFSFIQGTLINFLRSALLLLMFWLLFNGSITLGQLFSLLFYSFFIFNPLSEFGTVATHYQEARASNEQLEKVLAMESEKIPEGATPIETVQEITYKDVGFQYQDGKEVLKNISFSLRAGESIAFVGPSGAGKSTIIKLLVGLYRPTSGSILLNTMNVEQVDYRDVRKKIGYVSQDTQLFAGTIRENLLFVSPQASDAECLDALKQASAMPIIERGGKGLDTKIGEGGIKISGGEKQRLAIARALLREPQLIIFDEATSSLDSITEKSITETIQQISKTKPHLMTVLVAHRLSTIAYAKTIFVLEKGSLVEKGSHSALLKKKGLYYALWREQIGERV